MLYSHFLHLELMTFVCSHVSSPETSVMVLLMVSVVISQSLHSPLEYLHAGNKQVSPLILNQITPIMQNSISKSQKLEKYLVFKKNYGKLYKPPESKVLRSICPYWKMLLIFSASTLSMSHFNPVWPFWHQCVPILVLDRGAGGSNLTFSLDNACMCLFLVSDHVCPGHIITSEATMYLMDLFENCNRG